MPSINANRQRPRARERERATAREDRVIFSHGLSFHVIVGNDVWQFYCNETKIILAEAPNQFDGAVSVRVVRVGGLIKKLKKIK